MCWESTAQNFKPMIIKPADRTRSVKEYYFSVKNKEIAGLNAERKASGLYPVINLGIGSPDGMPPESVIETLREVSLQKGAHRYQSYTGTPELRGAFAKWYERWYGVSLDPSCEIQPLMGSKEGILIITLAFVNEGDKVLIPDPGYPTYTTAASLAGARIVKYDLRHDNGWYPDFDALEKEDLSGVKIMWTNYPNMPTGAPASAELYQKIADFAARHKILVINDNPYSFIQNDKPLSLLAAKGARECCLEMNSLSKAHNMSGWRVGMVGGNADYIREILKVKSQMDSGMFRPLQLAAATALGEGPDWFSELNSEYARRKAAASEIFDALGVSYDSGSQGLFLWGRVEEDNPAYVKAASKGYAVEGKTRGEVVSDYILYNTFVFITPGFVFGHNGENYIRASLCADVPTLKRACGLIKNIL